MTQTYGPYSPAQTASGLVYTAGQIGATKGKAAVGIIAQTKLALKNLAAVLEDAGSSMSNVVKTTVYLADIKHFDQMNQVYAVVFGEAGCSPSRSCVAVAELPRVADKPLLVEIEAVASLIQKDTAL